MLRTRSPGFRSVGKGSRGLSVVSVTFPTLLALCMQCGCERSNDGRQSLTHSCGLINCGSDGRKKVAKARAVNTQSLLAAYCEVSIGHRLINHTFCSW